MYDYGIRFCPIPRKSPIPHKVVAIIGGVSGINPTFVLSLNKNEIVVQAATDPPGFGSSDDIDKEHPFYEFLVFERSEKIYGHYLEIIVSVACIPVRQVYWTTREKQTLLSEIDFGKTNWAYLTYQNRGGPGGYQITQRQRRIPQPTCPPWGRLIYESEIEYTVYGLAGDRRGIWNGKEVGTFRRFAWPHGTVNNISLDVMVGWDESHMEDVDRAMYGYRLLEGMDLTFEFYGHLVGSDGKIKGIVSEAGWGRMVTLDDFTRVYRTVSRIQKRGLLYRACLTNRFMIANNKVRLLDLSMVDASYVSRPDELEKKAEKWHWSELTQLFHEIKTIGPYGDYRVPFHRFLTSYEDLECLPFPPSPERPLGGIMLYPDFFRHYNIDPWPEYVGVWDKAKELRAEALRKGSLTRLYTEMETNLTEPSFSEEDRPLAVSRLRHHHRHRAFAYPYCQKRRKLFGSEDTSSSGYSGVGRKARIQN
jgi:hypothetical protein